MTTPVRSSLHLRYSVEDLVRNSADLDKVNKKLLGSGYSHTRIGYVTSRKPVIVSPTTEHPRRSKADVLSVDDTASDTSETVVEYWADSPTLSDCYTSGSLSSVSPDSQVPCNSSDCPIKNIKHNIGRYFHNGEEYVDPSAPDFEFSLAGLMKEVSDAFNRTVPPPEIVTAYTNIKYSGDQATKSDLNMVREYQKHHMWAPTESEPSTPYPRHQYSHNNGLYSHMPPGNEKYMASDGVTSVFDEKLGHWSIEGDDETDRFNGFGPFSFEQEGSQSLLSSDFDASDDEHLFPSPLFCAQVADQSSVRPLLSDVVMQSEDEVYHCDDEATDSEDTLYGPSNDSYISLSTMREIPCGRELMSDKLRLQEKILKQIANEALKQAEHGEEHLARERQPKVRRHEDTNRNSVLEVLLELMDAVPQALGEGGFRSVLLDEKQDNKGFSDAEFGVLSDIQIMLQREFQAMMTDTVRPYVPTGRPVTIYQLREKLNDMMIGRQIVLEDNPGESIAEIVGYFFPKDKNFSSL